MRPESKPQTLREILKWPENWTENDTADAVRFGFPTVEEVFQQEIRSAEYCWGRPLPAEGWRDVACGMRDWARKIDDIRKGAT